jgi:hypothetical protein
MVEEQPMHNQIVSLVLAFLTFFLCGACQTADPAPISTAMDMSPLPTLTDLPIPTDEATPTLEPLTISVPQGKPDALDGSMSHGEWDNALIENFSGGSKLFLMYSDGFLYLAIRANTSEMIVGNIYINTGDEIAILHTSAALGTGYYLKDGDQWQLAQGFNWACRNTSNSEAAENERDVFLQKEGWVSLNSRIGAPNELEYKIKISEDTIRMAANYIKASEPNIKIPWPQNLDDGCTTPTPGGLPQQMHFAPEKWGLIIFIP